MRIAIDIGGVLIGKCRENNNLFDVPDSLSVLKHLLNNHRLYIISYSKERMARYNYTAISPYNLFWGQYYVEKKSYKSYVIRHLNCNVMIDDNENILNQIKEENPEVITILFQRYNKQKKRNHKKHYLVENWREIITLIEGFETITIGNEIDNKGSGYYISE